MKRSKFLISLSWELKNLFRFPFPEILLALFTYMIFLPHGGGFSFTVSSQSLIWDRITRTISFHTTLHAAHYSLDAYIVIGIFASIFATLAFAYEIENGLLKVHLSHPICRRSLFLAKSMSCFFIVFITFSASLLTYALLHITENAFCVILSFDLVLKILLVAALQSLFMASISISFSLYSRKTAVSLIGSFTTIYLIQLLSENARIELLPPTSFREQVSFLFSRMPLNASEISNFLILPLASILLIILSYFFFSRRLEVS